MRVRASSGGSEQACTDCCPHGWNCCDNGTCMEYDQFCRYPKECCSQEYCGTQCCSSAHGVPCGPLCAPLDYHCCNSATGQLCKKPDVCCDDHCCPGSHFCCDGNCCENGKVCCNGKCCEGDQECCVDHCCLSGEGDVCQAGETCCPPERLCNDKLCCPAGDFCHETTNTCCDNAWCGSGSSGICCHRNYYCNKADGCCPDGYKYCQYGSRTNCHAPPYTVCCDGGSACTEDNPLCADGWCCPYEYPTVCENGFCYNTDCQCCGDKCCVPPFSCQGGDCQHCYTKGHWWWKHTVCDIQPSSDVHAVRGEEQQGPTREEEVAVPGKRSARIPSVFIAQTLTKSNLTPVESPKRLKTVRTGTVIPPPPTKILSPNTFPCWKDKAALNDTCYAFECMVNMTRCGSTGYLADAHRLYCVGVEQYRPQFTSAGKGFLDKMQQCIRDAHLAVFNSGVLPCCNSLETWGDGTMQMDCFIQSGFCDVFMGNAGAFDKLFLADSIMNVYTLYFKYCHISP